jgi:hypothetical protein
MKLREIRNPVLIAALEELSSQKLPMVLGYKVNLMQEKIDAALRGFEKTRLARAADLASKDEEGKPMVEANQYILSETSLSQLNQEIAELENEEIEVPSLSLSQFPATVNLTPKQIGALKPLFGE